MPKKLPYGALRLVDVGSGCNAFAEETDGKKKLKMTVYSGGVIKGHWWWGNLAVDLNGMKFPKSKYPVLENHNTDRKIAFTGKPIVDGSIVLNPETTQFVSTKESEEFQKTSAEGFPFQASMYCDPTSVERIREGESAEVNGFTMKGPGTIWRKSIFQEASVCVFGWDKQTEASAFSKDKMTELEYEEIGGDVETVNTTTNTFSIIKEEEVKEMPKTVKELQEKYPELVKQLTDGLTSAFAQEKEGLETKITQLSTESTKKEERIDYLEKKDIIRTEKEIASDAELIISKKLAASEIPDRLHDKIRRLLSHNKFVKEDVLDTKAFAEFVDAELKEYEDLGITSKILGLGNTLKTEKDSTKLAEEAAEKEDDDAVDKMATMVGHTKKE